jgi:Sucrase/ferredoxin-like
MTSQGLFITSGLLSLGLQWLRNGRQRVVPQAVPTDQRQEQAVVDEVGRHASIGSTSKDIRINKNSSRDIPKELNGPHRDNASAAGEAAVSAPTLVNEKMRNSVKPYDRHAIVVYNHSQWAKHIEADESSFMGKLSTSISSKSRAAGVRLKLTGCHVPAAGTTAPSSSYGDYGLTSPTGIDDDSIRHVIIYPDAVIIEVSVLRIEEFVDILCTKTPILPVSSKGTTNSPTSVLTASPTPWNRLLLICTHTSRDKRCGRIGPQIMEAIESHADQRADGADGKATTTTTTTAVFGSSHIGGHEFAGTLISYPDANWYGQISKANTKPLMEAINGGGVYESHCRGNGGCNALSW